MLPQVQFLGRAPWSLAGQAASQATPFDHLLVDTQEQFPYAFPIKNQVLIKIKQYVRLKNLPRT